MDDEIRKEFPVLSRSLNGEALTYFDSAATALKPSCVINEELKYSTYYTANIHRGKHTLSEEASEAYENSRATVGAFLSTPASTVIFTKNATESINLIANGFDSKKYNKVLIPTSEHNSNIAPWMRYWEIVWMEHDGLSPLTTLNIQEAIENEKPDVLSFSMASNVTGLVNPAAELCKIARENGVLTCVDASQGVAHHKIDLQRIGCDFLVFSGHKMFGPTGIGVLAGTRSALGRLEPLVVGGGCIESIDRRSYTLRGIPHRFEAGTPNISGAIGLAAAVKYIQRIGFDNIENHQTRLADLLEAAVRSVDGCNLFMACDAPRLALGSFELNSECVSSEQIAIALSENYGIMVRSGSFCAHPLLELNGFFNGLIRISLSVYNTQDEIDYFRESLANVLHVFSPKSVHYQRLEFELM